MSLKTPPRAGTQAADAAPSPCPSVLTINDQTGFGGGATSVVVHLADVLALVLRVHLADGESQHVPYPTLTELRGVGQHLPDRGGEWEEQSQSLARSTDSVTHHQDR